MHASRGVVFTIEVSIASIILILSLALLYMQASSDDYPSFDSQQSMRVAHDMVTNGDLNPPPGYSIDCNLYYSYSPSPYDNFHAEVCMK